MKESTDGRFDSEKWQVIEGIESAGGITATEFNNRIYISGIDSANSVWVASADKSDLTTWELQTFDRKSTHYGDLVAYSNNLLLIVKGEQNNNGIYLTYSGDGTNWTDWDELDGKTITAPELVINNNGDLQMYVVGTTRQIWQSQEEIE